MVKYLPCLNTIILFLILIAIMAIGIYLMEQSSGLNLNDFIRYEDHDTGIVCYVLKNAQGISCLAK